MEDQTSTEGNKIIQVRIQRNDGAAVLRSESDGTPIPSENFNNFTSKYYNAQQSYEQNQANSQRSKGKTKTVTMAAAPIKSTKIPITNSALIPMGGNKALNLKQLFADPYHQNMTDFDEVRGNRQDSMKSTLKPPNANTTTKTVEAYREINPQRESLDLLVVGKVPPMIESVSRDKTAGRPRRNVSAQLITSNDNQIQMTKISENVVTTQTSALNNSQNLQLQQQKRSLSGSPEKPPKTNNDSQSPSRSPNKQTVTEENEKNAKVKNSAMLLLEGNRMRDQMVKKAQVKLAQQERSFKHVKSALNDFMDTSVSKQGKIEYEIGIIQSQHLALKQNFRGVHNEHKRTIKTEQNIIHVKENNQGANSLSKVTQDKIHKRKIEAEHGVQIQEQEKQEKYDLDHDKTLISFKTELAEQIEDNNIDYSSEKSLPTDLKQDLHIPDSLKSSQENIADRYKIQRLSHQYQNRQRSHGKRVNKLHRHANTAQNWHQSLRRAQFYSMKIQQVKNSEYEESVSGLPNLTHEEKLRLSRNRMNHKTTNSTDSPHQRLNPFAFQQTYRSTASPSRIILVTKQNDFKRLKPARVVQYQKDELKVSDGVSSSSFKLIQRHCQDAVGFPPPKDQKQKRIDTDETLELVQQEDKVNQSAEITLDQREPTQAPTSQRVNEKQNEMSVGLVVHTRNMQKAQQNTQQEKPKKDSVLEDNPKQSYSEENKIQLKSKEGLDQLTASTIEVDDQKTTPILKKKQNQHTKAQKDVEVIYNSQSNVHMQEALHKQQKKELKVQIDQEQAKRQLKKHLKRRKNNSVLQQQHYKSNKSINLEIQRDIMGFQRQQKLMRDFVSSQIHSGVAGRQNKIQQQYSHSQLRLKQIFGASVPNLNNKQEVKGNEATRGDEERGPYFVNLHKMHKNTFNALPKRQPLTDPKNQAKSQEQEQKPKPIMMHARRSIYKNLENFQTQKERGGTAQVESRRRKLVQRSKSVANHSLVRPQTGDTQSAININTNAVDLADQKDVESEHKPISKNVSPKAKVNTKSTLQVVSIGLTDKDAKSSSSTTLVDQGQISVKQSGNFDDIKIKKPSISSSTPDLNIQSQQTTLYKEEGKQTKNKDESHFKTKVENNQLSQSQEIIKQSSTQKLENLHTDNDNEAHSDHQKQNPFAEIRHRATTDYMPEQQRRQVQVLYNVVTESSRKDQESTNLEDNLIIKPLLAMQDSANSANNIQNNSIDKQQEDSKCKSPAKITLQASEVSPLRQQQYSKMSNPKEKNRLPSTLKLVKNPQGLSNKSIIELGEKTISGSFQPAITGRRETESDTEESQTQMNSIVHLESSLEGPAVSNFQVLVTKSSHRDDFDHHQQNRVKNESTVNQSMLQKENESHLSFSRPQVSLKSRKRTSKYVAKKQQSQSQVEILTKGSSSQKILFQHQINNFDMYPIPSIRNKQNAFKAQKAASFQYNPYQSQEDKTINKKVDYLHSLGSSLNKRPKSTSGQVNLTDGDQHSNKNQRRQQLIPATQKKVLCNPQGRLNSNRSIRANNKIQSNVASAEILVKPDVLHVQNYCMSAITDRLVTDTNQEQAAITIISDRNPPVQQQDIAMIENNIRDALQQDLFVAKQDSPMKDKDVSSKSAQARGSEFSSSHQDQYQYQNQIGQIDAAAPKFYSRPESSNAYVSQNQYQNRPNLKTMKSEQQGVNDVQMAQPQYKPPSEYNRDLDQVNTQRQPHSVMLDQQEDQQQQLSETPLMQNKESYPSQSSKSNLIDYSTVLLEGQTSAALSVPPQEPFYAGIVNVADGQPIVEPFMILNNQQSLQIPVSMPMQRPAGQERVLINLKNDKIINAAAAVSANSVGTLYDPNEKHLIITDMQLQSIFEGKNGAQILQQRVINPNETQGSAQDQTLNPQLTESSMQLSAQRPLYNDPSKQSSDQNQQLRSQSASMTSLNAINQRKDQQRNSSNWLTMQQQKEEKSTFSKAFLSQSQEGGSVTNQQQMKEQNRGATPVKIELQTKKQRSVSRNAIMKNKTMSLSQSLRYPSAYKSAESEQQQRQGSSKQNILSLSIVGVSGQKEQRK